MIINLNKVILKKSGDSHKINLSKGNNRSGKEIIIHLNRSQKTRRKKIFPSFFSSNENIDLNLGCFYELNNGQKSVIDSLQFAHGNGGSKDCFTNQGRYTDIPWIWHTGDNRDFTTDNGENILVNPQGLSELKRIIVYCFIYKGIAKWAKANAMLIIKVTDNPDIVIRIGKQHNLQKFCAVAEISFDANYIITVRKLVTFHSEHYNCDRIYHWGMKWTAGSK